MRGGTVSAWLAAILAGVLGSTIGFERMGAGTAAGGHATAGHRAGASAAPPPLTAPGGNWPPNQQGQQQGPNEEPRPSQPTKPVRQPSAKTGRKKGRSDRDQGAAEVVRRAAFAATAGNAEATTSSADLATPPMGVTEFWNYAAGLLSGDQLETLELRVRDGLTLREVSDRMGIPVWKLRRMLRAAKDILRKAKIVRSILVC